MGSPAIHKNLLTDPLPSAVYFDTNFVVNSLIKQEGNIYKNLACRYFLIRLSETTTKVYISAIIFPEFWHAALKIAVAKKQGFKDESEVYGYLKKHKRDALKEHISFINEMQNKFDSLMNLLNEKGQRVYVVETQRIISDEALRFMKDYQLLSYDALHFASAAIRIPPTDDKGGLEKPSVFDIVTLDSDIEGVNCEHCRIWNRGCDHAALLKYEKTLSKEKVQQDGVLIKELYKRETVPHPVKQG